MAFTSNYTCDECGASMGSSSAFTFDFPSRLSGSPLFGSKEVDHACSERCAAKVLRKVAARFDEMARWREEQDAKVAARAEAVRAQADAERAEIEENARRQSFRNGGIAPNPEPVTPDPT